MAKVLLVEDDNNLREIYEARLSAESYDIITAQNGEEALVVAKKEHPDLIISDVMMPRISGFEMLDILRNTDELRDTKVIMLTALGQAEDQSRAGKLGADKYLVKSQVTLEDIVNTANELLGIIPAIQQPTGPAPQAVAPAVATTTATAAPAITPAAQPVLTTPAQPSTQPTPESATVASPAAQIPPIPAADPITAAPAPEPVSILETSAPVAVTPLPTPEPVIAEPAPIVTAPTPEPVAPPAPVAAPVVVSPNPIADSTPVTPATETAETQVSQPPIVTVTDPDPITAAPAPEPVSIPEPSVPVAVTPLPTPEPVMAEPAPIVTAPTPEPVAPPVPNQAELDAAQTMAVEEAAVEDQIESFAATTPTVEPQTVAPEVTMPAQSPVETANDQTLTNAVNDLSDATNAGPEPALPPSQRQIPGEEVQADSSAPVTFVAPPIEPTEPVAPPAPETTTATTPETQAVAGHKIIQPLNSTTGPNLDELLAKEAAKEEQVTGAAPVVNGAPAPASPTTNPGFDPNSIAL